VVVAIVKVAGTTFLIEVVMVVVAVINDGGGDG
jgi:hypothetical protein